jgi:hypothetical protein
MGYSKLICTAPDINKFFVDGNYSYNAPNTISANIKMIKEVQQNYSNFMKIWGKEFAIEENIVACIICTESGGRNVGRNQFGAIGLMQVTAPTIYECVTKWNVMVDVPLSTTTKAVLSKYTPSWKNWDRNRKMTSTDTQNIEDALKKEEFNIALGCLCFRWMIDAFAVNGESNINKPIVAYNKGYYSAKNDMKGLTTTLQLFNKKGLGKEPKAYLLKMLGVNGFLDLWFKNIR